MNNTSTIATAEPTPVAADIEQPEPVLQEARPPLTPRQREIITALAKGETVKQIAYRLQISRRTIAAQIAEAKKRLGAQTRDEAVAIVVQRRVLASGK